jgi:hypothetical protein
VRSTGERDHHPACLSALSVGVIIEAAALKDARSARAAAASGNWAGARTAWQRALAATPPPAPEGWLLNALRASAALRDVAAARLDAAALLQHYPRSEAARGIVLRLLTDTRSRDALLAETTCGGLQDQPFAEALFPHFRALLVLEDYPAARGVFDRLVPLATTAARLHGLAGRAAICFAPDAMRERWRMIGEALATLPVEPYDFEDAAIRRTFRLRQAIALRDDTAYRQLWAQGGDIMPDWHTRLTALSARLNEPGFPDRQAKKVFGIGLSKTGTTSLAAALEMLGWRTAHHRNPITNAIIDGDDFDLFDALNDGPVSAHFETLYARYPNAVFICTTRPLASWQDSVRRHRLRIRGTETPRDLDLIAAQEGGHSPLTFRMPIHDAIWRHPDLAGVHAAWDQRITDFFRDKPAGKLLRFSMFEGDGWSELCGFLGCALPEAAFPHANKGTEQPAET